MSRRALAALAVITTLVLAPARAGAGELGPEEVFIDPMDVSLGLMTPGSPLSPRPQTELHLAPLEFHVMDLDFPDLWFVQVRDEQLYHYQLRLGGKVAFFQRFELGMELMPVHVTHASVRGGTTGNMATYGDTDVNFGNMALHFMANLFSMHGATPLYLSAAARVTFPTGGDVVMDLDGERDPGGEELVAKLDSWVIEPQLLFGITLADMVTLSTRQGLAIFVVGDTEHYPFLGDDQIHWYMNFAMGIAPIREWFSVVLDFTALFAMNRVEYDTVEHTWDDAHVKFLFLGLGAKVYPVDPLSIGVAARFGLNDETRESVGAYSVTLNASWEFDFAIGGITVIKEGQGAGADEAESDGGGE